MVENYLYPLSLFKVQFKSSLLLILIYWPYYAQCDESLIFLFLLSIWFDNLTIKWCSAWPRTTPSSSSTPSPSTWAVPQCTCSTTCLRCNLIILHNFDVLETYIWTQCFCFEELYFRVTVEKFPDCVHLIHNNDRKFPVCKMAWRQYRLIGLRCEPENRRDNITDEDGGVLLDPPHQRLRGHWERTGHRGGRSGHSPLVNQILFSISLWSNKSISQVCFDELHRQGGDAEHRRHRFNGKPLWDPSLPNWPHKRAGCQS